MGSFTTPLAPLSLEGSMFRGYVGETGGWRYGIFDLERGDRQSINDYEWRLRLSWDQVRLLVILSVALVRRSYDACRQRTLKSAHRTE